MGNPRYRIQIQKEGFNENWSNDYLTDDATLDDAQDLAALLLTWEQQIHDTTVNFSYIRISTYLPDDRIFRHLDINQPGLVTPIDHLPLYCTVRMDMGVSSSDPARKYYRTPLHEADQANGVLQSTFLTGMASLINTYLVVPTVLGHIVTNAGHTVISASINPLVQMRQLHRRKRPKLPA